MADRPLLAVDIDGVISLFGFEERPAHTQLQLVDGVPHCISLVGGDRLLRLSESFELVWASGWEDKANFYLPQLLGLPELPHVSFDVAARSGGAHWKLAALETLLRAIGRSPGSTTTSTPAVTSGRSGARRRRCWCRPSRTSGSRRATSRR